MREKEASENERQRYVKTVEKQERAIAALENVVAQSKQAHVGSVFASFTRSYSQSSRPTYSEILP